MSPEAETPPRRARVGFVYPRATLDSVPALCQAADLLAAHGYGVDFFVCDRPDTEPARFASPLVTQTVLGPEPGSVPPPLAARALRRVPGLRALSAALARSDAAPFPRLAEADALVRRRHASGAPYVCLFGVDPDGLDLADSLAAPLGIPLAYYSLELLLSAEMGSASDEQRRLKAREVALTRRAALCVVQDEARARLFAQDNGVAWERVALVPNAPLGPARRAPSDYWLRRFDLPPGTRVALHSGSLGDWTGIEDIVASVPAWPEGWVLVVHTRSDAASSPYVDRLRATADPRCVRFSLKPVPRDAYDLLVDGADVGIAFYVPGGDNTFTGSNIQTIGLSSGKVGFYARAGLPVVVNRASSLGDLVEAGGLGVSVADGRGIAEALARIEADAAGYGARARAFFDQHLDFARAFAEVIRRLDALAASVSTAASPPADAPAPAEVPSRLEPVVS